VDPPNLNIVARRNRWVPIRFATARYFETTESFYYGYQQAVRFNLLRRLDDDQNNGWVWDDEKAIIGIARTKASVWFGSADSQKAGDSQETNEIQKAGESQKTNAVGKFLLNITFPFSHLWQSYMCRMPQG
jgi:hypothetical protein